MEFLAQRDIFEPAKNGREGFALGLLSVNGDPLGYSLEDEDRQLEADHSRKVFGRTAIPRGRYELALTYSPRFKKYLPEILGVPTHSGVRIHGANEAEQLEGCIAVGRVRTDHGVAQCAPVVSHIIDLLQHAKSNNEKCWIKIR